MFSHLDLHEDNITEQYLQSYKLYETVKSRILVHCFWLVTVQTNVTHTSLFSSASLLNTKPICLS